MANLTNSAKLIEEMEKKVNSSSLATVATSGSYTDLSNKPTIPTVNDSTITVQKNGANVGSFTTNTATGKTINIQLAKADVGLGNVDNTSDANKPISNATQTALNAKADANSVYTKAEVDSAISSAVSSVYKYKGSVADYASLPTTGLTVGDVYNVEDTGDNYAWIGTAWDKLAGTVDLSSYLTKSEASSTYATKTEVNTKANTADVLTKTNTVTFTPTGDYQPATKKYVDDGLGNKLDKLSAGTLDKVYIVNTSGTQTSYNVSQGTSNNAIVRRSGTGIIVPDTPAANTHAVNKKYVDNGLSGKQDTLVSGTNIKTVNGNSLLGSGDIQTGGSYTAGNGIDITNDEIGLDGTYEGNGGKDYSAMRGPAPEGFHVPLTTEWQGVKTIMDGLGLTTSDNWRINLHIPFAGCRNLSYASIDFQGTIGYYWSSSPKGSDYPDNAHHLLLNSSRVDASSSYARAYGFSVRCFKNSFEAPTSSWTVINGTLGSAGIFWNQTEGLISITSNGTIGYTIQDKNLGATAVYSDGATLSEANCGKYYQWGNNYGFAWTGSVTTSSTKVNAQNYGPGNYYSRSTFIRGSYDWSSVHNDNLRGGETGVQPIMISGNLVLGDKLYKIVTSTTAPASGTASNIITIVTD